MTADGKENWSMKKSHESLLSRHLYSEEHGKRIQIQTLQHPYKVRITEKMFTDGHITFACRIGPIAMILGANWIGLISMILGAN